MPQAPTLPPEQMQQQQATGGANPLSFLIAAADMQKNGQLPSQSAAATPRRIMPKGQSVNLPPTSKGTRKNIRVIK